MQHEHHALIAFREQYMINPPIYGIRGFRLKRVKGRVRDLVFNSRQRKYRLLNSTLLPQLKKMKYPLDERVV